MPRPFISDAEFYLWSTVINLDQYRAAVGSWYAFTQTACCVGPQSLLTATPCLLRAGKVASLMRPSFSLCLLLLVLAGDIHPNPGPPNDVKFCHVNARSILKPGRLDEIYLDLCCLHNFDVICVSESHLSSEVPDIDINLPSYNVFRRDRNRHGGGVMIYVRDHFTCNRRTDLESDSIEMLWVELKLNNKVFFVGSCYRPPNQAAQDIENFTDCLYDSLLTITSSHNHCVVLMGDFNDRCINWRSDHSNSELGTKLVDLVDSLNLFQLVRNPTRNGNLLDLLITDCPAYFTDVGTLNPIDELDHCIVHGSLAITPPKFHTIQRRIWQYNHGNFNLFNNLLLLTDWDHLFSVSPDLDSITQRLTRTLQSYAELCIPKQAGHTPPSG